MATDIAGTRLDNALLLYTEFLRERLGGELDARTAMLEGHFAQQLRISASYWSQLKSRRRHIGETLARQFERLSGKPSGWLDVAHAREAAQAPAGPRDEDERFLVQLMLTCYRRNPRRAKQRLLQLLEGELAEVRGASVKNPHVAKIATIGQRSG